MNNNKYDWVPRPADEPIPDGLALEVKNRVSRIRTRMTQQVPFFGHLLLKLQPVITRRVPMAGVTLDRKLLINPDWAKDTREGELSTTLVHEVLHPAMLCFERIGTRQAIGWSPQSGAVSIWNIAHDYAINLIIEDMVKGVNDLVPPSDWRPKGCVDEKYRDWSAEEIYEDILKQAHANGQKGKGQGMQVYDPNAQPQQGQGQQGQPQQGPGIGQVDLSHMKDLHAGTGDILNESGGESDLNGKETEVGQEKGVNSTQQAASSQYWKTAIVEAAQVHEQKTKQRGNLPGSLQKFIDALTDPRIPWQDVLSRWVGENGRRSDFTYRRPSRRSQAAGEILPSMQRHGVSDVCVLWDTSGSMGGREIEIFSEVMGICEDLGLKLRVICCDMRICSDQEGIEDPAEIEVKGGGGSDFRPAFERLDEENYEGVVIAFTDGYIGVPTVKPLALKACLWVIWKNDVDPTHGAWGEVLCIDDEGYAR